MTWCSAPARRTKMEAEFEEERWFTPLGQHTEAICVIAAPSRWSCGAAEPVDVPGTKRNWR